MEEKHIYSTSYLKRIEDKLKFIKQRIQEYYKSYKSRPSQPKVSESSSPPPTSTQTKKTPKGAKEKFTLHLRVSRASILTNEKLLTYLLTFSVVVIMSLGIALSFKGQRQKNLPLRKSTISTTAAPTPSLPDTNKINDINLANWKTYKNAAFQFEYPSTWSDAKASILSTKTLVRIDDGKESLNMPSRLEILLGNYYDQSETKTLTIDEVVNKQQFPTEAYSSEKITLGSWQGSRHTYYVHGVGYFNTVIFLANPISPRYILSISYRHEGESEYESRLPKTLDQILSTFKFLD